MAFWWDILSHEKNPHYKKIPGTKIPRFSKIPYIRDKKSPVFRKSPITGDKNTGEINTQIFKNPESPG